MPSTTRATSRSRWLAAYALFLFVASEGLLRVNGGDARALLSLSSIVLYLAPLITIVFGTVYVYGAREFTELLLAQPVSRRSLFVGLYLGLTGPLTAALLLGIALPFAVHGTQGHGAMLIALCGSGVALTMIFSAFAFCIATWCEERLRGLAAAIAIWMLTAILYDGVVLMLIAALDDRPVEGAVLALTVANPIDLARVALTLQLDAGALMGYTGAVFEQFLGSMRGTLAAGAALLIWTAAPVALGARAFNRRDF